MAIEYGKWIRLGTGRRREQTLMIVLPRKNTAWLKGREAELSRGTGAKVRWKLKCGNHQLVCSSGEMGRLRVSEPDMIFGNTLLVLPKMHQPSPFCGCGPLDLAMYTTKKVRACKRTATRKGADSTLRASSFPFLANSLT